MSPLLTFGLAHIFLKEVVTLNQLGVLLSAFCGVLLMIVGGSKQDHAHMQSTKLQLFLMLSNPVLISTGELAMRSMRKMPETIVSLYMNFTLVVIMFLAIWMTTNDSALGSFLNSKTGWHYSASAYVSSFPRLLNSKRCKTIKPVLFSPGLS